MRENDVKRELPSRAPAVGFEFESCFNKKYVVTGLSLFVYPKMKSKEEWYLFFKEADCNECVSHTIRLSDFLQKINSINIHRLGSVHYRAPRIGSMHKLYKGGNCEVIDVAYNPFEYGWFVCYKDLYENPVADSFTMTLEDFLSSVQERIFPIPRFLLAT